MCESTFLKDGLRSRVLPGLTLIAVPTLRAILRLDERIEEGPEGIKCKICLKKFLSLIIIKQHLATVHNDATPFECDMCDKAFKLNSRLRRHIERVHERSTPTFFCELCGATLGDQKSFLRHAQRHLNIFKWKCHLCHKGFRTNQGLKGHMASRHDDDKHVCQTCGKTFSYAKTLELHFKTHDDEYIKNYLTCTVCEQTFSTKNHLERHVQAVHSENPKKLICDVCGKEMRSGSSFKAHMMSHDGIKPQKCPYCDKTFVQNGNLKMHLTTHTGEKPYKCNTCDRSFGQPTALKNHVRLHTGEKPYECNICQMKYTSGSALYSHKTKKHKILK